MKLTIILVIISLATVERCGSGFIQGWDVDLQWKNAGYCRKISLYFLLESGLPRDGSIKIRSSFMMNSQTRGLQATIGDNSENDLSPAFNSVDGNPIGDGFTFYFLPNTELSANKWYTLKISNIDPSQSSQTENSMHYIEMYTISSPNLGWVIDMNQALAVFSFAPPPLSGVNGLQVTPNYNTTIPDSSERKIFGLEYFLTLALIPKRSS